MQSLHLCPGGCSSFVLAILMDQICTSRPRWLALSLLTGKKECRIPTIVLETTERKRQIDRGAWATGQNIWVCQNVNG